MRQLVTSVGKGADVSSQWTELRQIQCRGIVTCLTDSRLRIHWIQRLGSQAVRIPVAVVGRDVAGSWSGDQAVFPHGHVVTSGAHVVSTMLQVVQTQDVNVRRVLDADVKRQVLVRIIQTHRYRQTGIIQRICWLTGATVQHNAG